MPLKISGRLKWIRVRMVRLKAEEQIHHAFVEAYHIWKEQCMSSQEEIPFIFDMEKVDGEFKITTNINMQKFPI